MFLQKIEASPAALLIQSRTQQKSFLFLLEEKIGRAQNQKRRENFFAGWRVSASGGGLASLVWFRSGISDKMSSSQTVKTHTIYKEMRTTYFLIAFIAAAALFFYLAGNFSQIQIANPFVSKNSSSTSNISNSNRPAANQPDAKNPASSSPSGFRGPTGQPGTGFIGPNGPPPNY